MSKQYYVYSTMTAAVTYCAWVRGGGDIPTIQKSVTINGGANVADKHFQTPRGVVTVISEEQLEIMKADGVFQIHQKNGFITVEEKRAEVERVVSDMEGQDESAPLTPNDFDDGTGPKPVEEQAPVAAPSTTRKKR